MNTFIFAHDAQRQFQRFDGAVQERILSKLAYLKDVPDLFTFLCKMHDVRAATHRLRVGDYRLIVRYKGDGVYLVLKVGHRKDVYR